MTSRPEMLDVVDAEGRPLGVKERGAVHRDGDWHVAFHLWIVTAGAVLLQRRARTKASWPGFLDATAAGHLTAGETVAEGIREVEEELGVAYRFDDLTPLGVHRVEDASRDGQVNREHQHVFAVRDDRPLEAYDALDLDELDGLVAVPAAAFARLVADGLPAPARVWDGRAVAGEEVGAGELVPAVYLAELAPLLAAMAR